MCWQSTTPGATGAVDWSTGEYSPQYGTACRLGHLRSSMVRLGSVRRRDRYWTVLQRDLTGPVIGADSRQRGLICRAGRSLAEDVIHVTGEAAAQRHRLALDRPDTRESH